MGQDLTHLLLCWWPLGHRTLVLASFLLLPALLSPLRGFIARRDVSKAGVSQLPDPKIVVAQHPMAWVWRSWRQQQGRELQDRLQDRFRSVFFKSLSLGLFTEMHIKIFVWSPPLGLDWVSHGHCPAGHRDSVPGSAALPGHEGTQGKLLGHPRDPQHRRCPSLLCPLCHGALRSRGLQDVAARAQPGWHGGIEPFPRDAMLPSRCGGDELGLIWAGVVLGPTLLWGEPEWWQLFSTLPGCWWHPGGQGTCGVMWLQPG